MRDKPEHTCFRPCAGCAFELGESLAKRKGREAAKFVWMVVGSDNPCDIRRYSFSHEEGIAQLSHVSAKTKYKDRATGGTWTLFKLVRVNKKSKP